MSLRAREEATGRCAVLRNDVANTQEPQSNNTKPLTSTRRVFVNAYECLSRGEGRTNSAKADEREECVTRYQGNTSLGPLLYSGSSARIARSTLPSVSCSLICTCTRKCSWTTASRSEDKPSSPNGTSS